VTREVEFATNSGSFLIEDVYPIVDAGRFPVKRIVNEPIEVWADVFRDGHDVIAAEVLWRPTRSNEWRRAPMRHYENDRWSAVFTPEEIGWHQYTISAWTDEFATWRRSFQLKAKAGAISEVDAMEGAALLSKAQCNAASEHAQVLSDSWNAFLQSGDADLLLSDRVAEAMTASQLRYDETISAPLPLVVDRPAARASAWYEMVPRSQGKIPGKHGTFVDCIARLPDVAAMGFDVLYFTPIHPIGRINRKGRNNALTATADDPGSPYAIGSADGGHNAVHPELGSLDDFHALIAACKEHGMEVALDFAVQCSPDHPWLKQHPAWFKRRADGTMKYAENPPKKYEDIVNPDFHGKDAAALRQALCDVVLFWVEQGVKIFRVDNPHTKPFPFWAWLIREVQSSHPDVLFLAEAFTRPKVMKGLAKLGFSQSYTYFTWRTRRAEIETYLKELTGYPERDFYRPNFFVNTPDILPFHLQGGESWMFKSRVALAATLSGAYGIYNGFELLEHEAIPGKEEYGNSEKYEIKVRDWDAPGNIKPYITQLNRIRRRNSALQQTSNLTFVPVNDANVIGFFKEAVDQTNTVAVAIALSPEPREFWLPLGDAFTGAGANRKKVVALENLATGERYGLDWGGIRLRIDPAHDPALLFRCLA
jgi:starch synthase (maltosyl-transferring)